MQAQGVIGHQLLAIEQQLATQARERSMQAMEEASRLEMEQFRMDKALQPLDTTYKAKAACCAACAQGGNNGQSEYPATHPEQH